MKEAHGCDFDIVIAGGGMVGTCLALALAPLGLRVAVVEAVERGIPGQPSFDDRSTALSRSSRRMFEAMRLWEQIEGASTPIASIHVSERGRFGFAHIDAHQQKVDALGYVVINRVLGDVLQSAMTQVSGLEFLCPARITAVNLETSGATVTVDRAGQSTNITCSLLVAADGANSTVRSMLGIGARQRGYGQHAVIGNVLPEVSPANRAFERFTQAGALALLPVAGDRAAFVWCLPDADAAELMLLPDSEFIQRLQETFGLRLGQLDRVGRRACYPLTLSQAEQLTARRSALVGNAAHGLHPVAAQGFNLGMRDVAALCDCIADAMRTGGAASIGSEEVLAAYREWRYDDQRKVVQFTDGLVRLFGTDLASVRTARNIAMLGFDLLPGVRTLFARHTMGLAGRLPRLARGVPLE
ncbi:MAG TPA: 2-octaprenyl-6-methoxyphenyl hydroxylase [Woeseiaceae bacterium]